MFERLGIITFIRSGLFSDTFSNCHIYLDGSRVLLKYDDFAETYFCSENDIQLNFVFMEQLKMVIKLLQNHNDTNISLKQLISFHDNNTDQHTKDLQNLIINMLPGTQIIHSYSNDPNFMYMPSNTYLICHNDYAEYFLHS